MIQAFRLAGGVELISDSSLASRQGTLSSRTALLVPLFLASVVFPAESLSQDSKSVPPPFRFSEVAAESGIVLENLSGGARKDYLLEVAGNGAAWFDYDGDGWMDLLIVNGSTIEHLDRGGDPMAALYHNNGNGTFTDVTRPSGMKRNGWGMGVCAADIDNDGDTDVYITGYGSNVLYQNNGDGTFRDVTATAHADDTRWSTGCAFGDFDLDGWLDLYVANYVALDVHKTPTRGVNSFCQYMGMDVLCGPRGLPGAPDLLLRNNGDGTFADVTGKAGIHDPGHYGFQVLFSDLDGDGWPDIYVANDSTPNFLFHNNHDSSFTDIALESGVAFSEEGRAQASMGLDAADYDHDGQLDIFVTNFSHDTNTLYRNAPGGYRVATFAAGLGESSLAYLGWGAGLVDLDNDGWLDLVVANGHIYPEIDLFPLGSKYRQRLLIYRHAGSGRFAEVAAQMGEAISTPRAGRGIAFADYDNDGDMDFLVVNLDGRPALFRNDTQNEAGWLSLQLVGTRSNRSAIGARVSITAGETTQMAEVRSGGSYLSSNDPRLHFGLGKEREIARIEVRWPSGLVQQFEDIQAGRSLLLVEGNQPVPGKRGTTRN